MDSKLIYYSVLEYVPSPIRQENIILGVVIHIPSDNYSTFFEIKNKHRVRSFDDEYDPKYMNSVLSSLKFDFNFDSIDSFKRSNRFNLINSEEYLSEKTKYYVNEFRFRPIQKIMSTSKDLLEDVNDIISMYLYYDRPKGKRITKNKVNSLLNKSIKNFKLQNHIKKSTYTLKYFDSKPIFDFESNSDYIKTLTLDYLTNVSYESELKVALFDLMSADSTNDFTNKKIKLIINNEASTERITQLNNTIDIYLKHCIPEVLTLSDYVSLMEQGKY